MRFVPDANGEAAARNQAGDRSLAELVTSVNGVAITYFRGSPPMPQTRCFPRFR
jgi:hypothetical protein